MCKYQAEISRSQIVFVENADYCGRFLQSKDELPLIKCIVQWDNQATEDAKAKGVVNWNDFIKRGTDTDGKLQQEVEQRQNNCKVNQCAALVFTSGTTGYPKAVMCSHDNVTFTGYTGFIEAGIKGNEESMVSFLPLSHVAALMSEFIACFGFGVRVYFSDNTAMKGGLVNFLTDVHPTLILAVPRGMKALYNLSL